VKRNSTWRLRIYDVVLISAMHRTYDIFEKLPDGSLIWRVAVVGHEESISKLKELGRKSKNEFVLMHTPDKAVIATVNSHAS
jgi:hypothetical protein